MRRNDHALLLPQSVPPEQWLPSPGSAYPHTPQRAARLTQRERDVLALLCQRRTDQEIAAQLFIGRRTVATHVSNILAKLGAANRREAAAISTYHGLV